MTEKDIIHELLDVVLRINTETELSAVMEVTGYIEEITITIAKGKEPPEHIDYVYHWYENLDGRGQFDFDDKQKAEKVYHEISAFLPKENALQAQDVKEIN